MNKNKLFHSPNFFTSQTKKDWQNATRGKKISHIFHKKKYDPIYFKDEKIPNSTFLYNTADNVWKINVEIKIKNEEEANKKALEYLNLGINSITFSDFKNHELKKILRGIHVEIIEINFKNFKNFDNLVFQINQFAINKQIDCRTLKGIFYNKNISESEYRKYSEILPEFKFLEESILLNETKHSFVKKKHIVFKLNATKSIFEDITRIRAFRIRFENKFHFTPYIETLIRSTEKQYNPLIESCVKSISSILAGISSVFIPDNKTENTRLIIQQQLILKNESYLHKVNDPLNGSYIIEKITNDLINEKVKTSHNIKFTKWQCSEQIRLKSKYSNDDTKNLTHTSFGVGTPPYLRGPYSTMYSEKKWTIRQYAGFSTAKESNDFYKKNLSAGQSGLSVAFDLPTHRGYDSDHDRVFGDVGKAGVAVDSIQDMEELFEGIDLNKTSVSMTMNGAILPVMAFFIVMCKNKDIQLSKVRGTIQNDILKEFMVRNTYIYPPNESMYIVSDIFKYMAKNMPKFNCISVSGYHMLEAGASADIEVAYTLSDGLEYVRTGISAGLDIDDFAPRLSFFWGIGMNFFTEIAKMRAARIIWADLMKDFKPKNEKSMMLRCHCQTSGWSLTAQEPENNITRTTIEALAAILGGTQSLHTNALDEAISLPTNYSAKIARDTQLFLQNETDLCKLIDSFGGSYYLEKLTHDIKKKAQEHIKEIEKAGGMLKAIEQGMPKLKIEESAIRRQSLIDKKDNLIVGLNCYINKAQKEIDVLEVDNKKVQKVQIEKIQKLKKQRDHQLVTSNLQKLTKACITKKTNLMQLAIACAQSGATLGEISDACEKSFSRYIAKTSLNSGIYSMEQKNEIKFIEAQKLTKKFKKNNGRRPRILAAKLGQDGHDRGIKVIATSFADIGFDVDIAPLFQTPKEIAKQAIENDVHIIGISSLAGGHNSLIPELIQLLKQNMRQDIVVIIGGIIPKKDYNFLREKGVKKIFGPGTVVVDAAIEILKQL
tara:strand:+ start:3425 stop:6421 length:2997 start_codon:yes stop_codon:yes gene_type:complete